jgi:hypothetical protein
VKSQRISRLLKNAPLLRLRSSCVTAAYKKNASFRMILRALHLSIFEQPVCMDFFSTLLEHMPCGLVQAND